VHYQLFCQTARRAGAMRGGGGGGEGGEADREEASDLGGGKGARGWETTFVIGNRRTDAN
jgi:hypothetical protein